MCMVKNIFSFSNFMHLNIICLTLIVLYIVYQNYDELFSNNIIQHCCEKDDNEISINTESEINYSVLIKEKMVVNSTDYETIAYVPWIKSDKYTKFILNYEVETLGSVIILNFMDKDIIINKDGFQSTEFDIPSVNERLVLKIKKQGNNNPKIFGISMSLQ